MSDNTLFELATAGTCFRVFDVETCVGLDRYRRILSLSITEIRNGVVSKQSSDWLFDPQIRIDEASHRIHGLSDEDVAGQPTFAQQADMVLNALSQPPQDDPNARVVWVCHNAAFDVSALAWACEQATVALPRVPVLDTMWLPQLLGEEVPAFASVSSKRLPDLATHYGVADEHTHHNAASDAYTTARLFREMLREVVDAGLGVDAVLAVARESDEFGSDKNLEQRAPVHPRQDETHVAAHPQPLLKNAGRAAQLVWARQFLKCALVGCEHVRLLADEFAQHPTLLDHVFRIARTTLEPGSMACNTLLGSVSDPSILATWCTNRMLMTKWIAWRKEMSPIACSTLASRVVGEDPEPAVPQCPDCREGEPCPADVFYQTVARVLVGYHRNNRVPDHRITHYAVSAPLRDLTSRGASDVAGGVAWLCIDQAQQSGQLRTASKIASHAHRNHLDLVEPRLTLWAATRAVAHDERGAARDMCEAMLAQASSDPAFEDLRDFYQQHLLPPRPDRARVLKTKPRYGVTIRRPVERRYQPRFKVG